MFSSVEARLWRLCCIYSLQHWSERGETQYVKGMAHNERQRVCSLKKLWAASASASASFPCHVIVDRQARRDGLAFFAYKMMLLPRAAALGAFSTRF